MTHDNSVGASLPPDNLSRIEWRTGDPRRGGELTVQATGDRDLAAAEVRVESGMLLGRVADIDPAAGREEVVAAATYRPERVAEDVYGESWVKEQLSGVARVFAFRWRPAQAGRDR